MRRIGHRREEPFDAARLPLAMGARVRLLRALRGVGRFLVDWFPVFVVLFVYDAIHNRLGRFLPPAHTLPQIRVDEALSGGIVPSVRMQRAFYSQAHPQWWDYATLAVYTSHFFVPILVGLSLWVRSRPLYLRFMMGLVGLTTLGYVTYVLFPAVPPWLASQRGALAPTHRLVRELWEHLGQPGIASLFSGTTLYANDVAAIPSLHAAYPVMIAMFFWQGSRAGARVALALYAVVMALGLVYSAEHYILDILLGWLYAFATALAMRRLEHAPGCDVR
jgi:membrane-associated phospholipid phosphatase